MKKLLFFTALLLAACTTVDQVTTHSKLATSYLRGKAFSAPNLNNLVAEAKLEVPTWIDGSDDFIYRFYPKGNKMQYMFFDAQCKRVKPLFKNEELAAAMGTLLGEKINANWLGIGEVRTKSGQDNMLFTYEKKRYNYFFKSKKLKLLEPKEGDPGEKIAPAGWQSPDGKWEIVSKKHNLFLRNTSTKVDKPLTTGGTRAYGYGLSNVSPSQKIKSDDENLCFWPSVQWSPDSKKFASYLADYRGISKTITTLSSPKDGSVQKSFSSYFIYAGQENAIKINRYVFDIETGKSVKVDLAPESQLNWGTPFMVHWTPDSSRYYLHLQNRARTELKLVEVNAVTGQARTVIERHSDTGVPEQLGYYQFTSDLKEVFLIDESDGWAHVYHYDLEAGELLRQVTKGEWGVRKLNHIDEKERVIYFTAGGMSKGSDPYYNFLYRINFDGSGLQLLTPEEADHQITFLPSGNYFLDGYSRLDNPGKTILYQNDGTYLDTILEADDTKLIKKGYIYPENFVAKGRDGQVDIYGTVFRPSNFDPNKKYPVIESIYPGPHNFFAIKNFSAYYSRESAMAQLGFIVVMIDGQGSFGRSKAFRDVCYKNLKDAGLPDRVAWIKALAAKYGCIDLDRVGIYGHSAGGYAAVRAMLDYSEFYKVCVSSSGNHDNRLGGAAGWAEVWMGYPIGPQYDECSNILDANKLQGHLLLLHGEVDDNVPMTTTLRLANELNKYGKNFQMVIAPNDNHALDENFWTRHRWNFFVEHLLGQEPPLNYKLGVKVKFNKNSK